MALYSADVHKDPPPEYWLDVKRRYVAASPLRRRRMELSYLWHFRMQRKPWKLLDLILYARRYKKSRGMNFMTDVRDWLGGWPMEFCRDADVVDLVSRECGMTLVRMKTGRANTEFLFQKPPAP
jgi:2-polyprenyl-6-hydroxyphenyl methylase/3-demethylubiquinone-9 3-methyltransferase